MDDKGRKLNEMTAGQVFGEKALLNNTKRTATLISNTHCEFATLDRDRFLEVMGLSSIMSEGVKMTSSVDLSEVLMKPRGLRHEQVGMCA